MGSRAKTSVLGAMVCVIAAMSLPVGAAATLPYEGIPHFGHVFLIVGENTTYSHIKPSNMPYLLGTLKPRSAWMTEYRGTTHWSQANYVAMTSGQFTRCEQQDYGIACHQNVPNLFNQIDSPPARGRHGSKAAPHAATQVPAARATRKGRAR